MLKGQCTFLEVDGDIPSLIPDESPDDDVIEENRKRLVEHLEFLIVSIKDGSSLIHEINPKATAGEDVGAEYTPTEADPDKIDGLFDDVEPPRREDAPIREEAEAPVEDHDGLIEVDVDRGESRYAKPGTLKREAKTLDHLMTHRCSNPYCDSCIRAKMRHCKTRRTIQEEVIQVG